jgi:DNA-binding transcriptional regulator GbsR (MarR family)
MNLQDAKLQFLQVWGTLGSSWGINRTMAQLHALLMVSAKNLSTEEIMEELSISRGNVNMNLRELMNWNLIYKVVVPGDRKEYFKAEKDVWEITKRIATERKRREIGPLKAQLASFEKVDAAKNDIEAQEFIKMVSELNQMISKVDHASNLLLKAEQSKLFTGILKLFPSK